MNTHDLVQLEQDMLQLSSASARCLLAHAAVWLNPREMIPNLVRDEDNGYFYDPLENLPEALDVVACYFPTTGYSQAVQAMWSGQGWNAIIRQVFQTIAREMNISEDVVVYSGLYSIPLEYCGLSRGSIDPDDFADCNNRLLPVLSVLGVYPFDDEPDVVWAFERAAPVGSLLMHQLAGQSGSKPGCRDLAWLICWLFGLSHNTLVDWSESDYAEAFGEGLEWSSENVEFAREMQAEAGAIHQAAMRGLEWFEADPALREAFKRNVELAAQYLEDKDKKGEPDARQPEFRWPDGPGGADAAAAAGQLEHLPLWPDPAQVQPG